MIKNLLFLLSLTMMNCLTLSSQDTERGVSLPIANQNAGDLEYGFNGTYYLSVNYDHMFFLKPVRYGPGILLRGGLGDGLSPGYGMIILTEAAYTTGYLTFAELGAGYNGRIYEGSWQNLPYFLATFRYRSNSGFSLRLFSRLIIRQSEEIPLFGLGLSFGLTF